MYRAICRDICANTYRYRYTVTQIMQRHTNCNSTLTMLTLKKEAGVARLASFVDHSTGMRMQGNTGQVCK